jgi:hypothetical protein
MKKIISLLAVAVFILGVTCAANATYLGDQGTIGQAEFMTFTEVNEAWYPNFEVTSIYEKPKDSIWVEFLLTGGPGEFTQGAIGWDFPVPAPYSDLSMYEGIRLIISNDDPCGKAVQTNISINTGWTDAPWSEPDRYYQNTWTWIESFKYTNPGVVNEIVLTLDFNDAELWENGDYIGTGQVVQNLEHVTNISVHFGALTTGEFKVDIDPVPEPGSMLLILSGLLGLAAFKRKKM